MVMVIDGDGDGDEVDGKMLHWWYAAVIKGFIKFDLHKLS